MYRRIFLGATVTAVLSLTLPAMTIAASPSAVTPSEAPVILPAGTQYSGAIEGLPRKLPVTGMTDKLIASHDGVVVALGSDGLRVQAGIRDRDGHWDLAQVDRSGRVKAPKGLRSGLGIGPSAVAGGPNGFVAVGDTAFTNGTTKFGLVPLIWHSSDGHTWKRFDARKIMGANLSGDLNTVIATEQGGFLAAGSVAPLGLRGRSTIVIIGSPDGVDWRQLGTIDGTWSLAADRLLIVGDSLVLVGTEYALARPRTTRRTR